MSETYTDPRTFIAFDVNGGALPIVCLWPSGETTIANIHGLSREIRDRDQIDAAIPVAVYIREGKQLAEATLDVQVDGNTGLVTVEVTRNRFSGIVTIARGWYDS